MMVYFILFYFLTLPFQDDERDIFKKIAIGKTIGMVTTMPLSLKTIGSASYRDQRNKRFGFAQVNRKRVFKEQVSVAIK